MPEELHDPHRQQRLYWNQMLQLKSAAIYMRLYRERLGRKVKTLGMLKAIASCGGIAAWAVWKEFAPVWAGLIALSQLADALKDVFPFAKTHKSANDLCTVLNTLFIDAELEWEAIYLGRYSDDETMSRLHKLKKLQLVAEQRCFPEGFSPDMALQTRAEREALEYFVSTSAIE